MKDFRVLAQSAKSEWSRYNQEKMADVVDREYRLF